MRGNPRMPYDEFVALIDVEATTAFLDAAMVTLGELPCQRHSGSMCKKIEHPRPHESCPRCFTWRDCTNPECEHPACGHGPERRFFTAFEEAFPDLARVDVLKRRSDPRPLIESGRLAILLDEIDADEKAGRTVYAAMQKTHDWQRLYDFRIDATKHVEAEVWLIKQGIHVECVEACYGLGTWVAMNVAAGTPDSEGGMFVREIRLTEPSDLSNAAGLTQGALF